MMHEKYIAPGMGSWILQYLCTMPIRYISILSLPLNITFRRILTIVNTQLQNYIFKTIAQPIICRLHCLWY